MSSSILKIFSDALEEATKLENRGTKRKFDSGGIQRTEEQLDQIFEEMGDMRMQFQDMKKQMEDVKGQGEDTKIQLENTKTELNETKIQLEDSKIQLENTKTELNETKIKFEDTKIQLKESKIQSKETNIKLEESKIKIEETKSQLDESKIQLEDTKIQLEYSKTKTSKLEKKLGDKYEYTKDPCKNCNGSTFCLDGQVIRNTPGKGTKIRALKGATFKGSTGTPYWVPADVHPSINPAIDWNKLGYSAGFNGTMGFVYNCK
ncbi:uncharacterized protein LOC111703373 isoform X2 [Eurytemora carolleeae]|uniref:uncharacterized protein LOC111703373 isoform X2 n=1 Tax=Eurytemora carolleeae TaxID=1294199 RepID=UPI000C764026|nr:uncharacterized protein LOC111703373 isoform X2 [Eurytemora carolleeae]|eukprot:XP_023331061.1 uncharacterized protein LOC111703373 isoform X2 [Eurytemora affinis]